MPSVVLVCETIIPTTRREPQSVLNLSMFLLPLEPQVAFLIRFIFVFSLRTLFD